MFFKLSKIAWYFLDPGNVVLLMALSGIVLSSRCGRPTWQKTGHFLTMLAIGILVVVTILPVGRWMIVPLEKRFPAQKLPDHIEGVVVLGGVLDLDIATKRDLFAMNGASDRLFALIDLSNRYPDSKIVFTGGSGKLLQTQLGEATLVKELLHRLKVIDDPDRLVFEDASRNTYENAVMSFDLVKPEQNQTWLLVTSAMHMPRAVGVFRHAGWPDPVPVPVDYQTTGIGDRPEMTLGRGLMMFSRAMREWIGLIVYYATGRMNTLFPAPLIS